MNSRAGTLPYFPRAYSRYSFYPLFLVITALIITTGVLLGGFSFSMDPSSYYLEVAFHRCRS